MFPANNIPISRADPFSCLVSLKFLVVCHHLHYLISAYSLSEVEHSTRLLKKLFNEKYARDLIPRCNDEIVQAKVGIALRGLLDVVSSILFILRKYKCYHILIKYQAGIYEWNSNRKPTSFQILCQANRSGNGLST